MSTNSPSAEPELHGNILSVSVTVKDLAKSLTWYTEVAGFAIDRKIEHEGKLRAVALKAGNVRIAINQDDGAKGWTRVKGEGFSLQVVTDQNIDAVADRIKKHGGTLESEPADMPWGVRMFRLKDPDGYKISISSPRPA